jgi:hypothetical protein
MLFNNEKYVTTFILKSFKCLEYLTKNNKKNVSYGNFYNKSRPNILNRLKICFFILFIAF